MEGGGRWLGREGGTSLAVPVPTMSNIIDLTDDWETNDTPKAPGAPLWLHQEFERQHQARKDYEERKVRARFTPDLLFHSEPRCDDSSLRAQLAKKQQQRQDLEKLRALSVRIQITVGLRPRISLKSHAPAAVKR